MSDKILELSNIAISQLVYEALGVTFDITYSDKEINQVEINKLIARYVQEVYVKWMDRFDFPYQWEIVKPRNFSQLILFVYDGTITEKQAKDQVFPYMWEHYTSPEWAILDLQILQNKSKYDLDSIVNKLISDNPNQVEQFKSGNNKIIGFFMGRVMKETEGSFDPNQIKMLIMSKLQVDSVS